MEQVAVEMVELTQEVPEAKKEMPSLNITIRQQDGKIQELHGMLKDLVETKHDEGSRKESVAA